MTNADVERLLQETPWEELWHQQLCHHSLFLIGLSQIYAHAFLKQARCGAEGRDIGAIDLLDPVLKPGEAVFI